MDMDANLSGLVRYDGCGLVMSVWCYQCDSWWSHGQFVSFQSLLIWVHWACCSDGFLDPLFRSTLQVHFYY